jgi:hypothetical protein
MPNAFIYINIYLYLYLYHAHDTTKKGKIYREKKRIIPKVIVKRVSIGVSTEKKHAFRYRNFNGSKEYECK